MKRVLYVATVLAMAFCLPVALHAQKGAGKAAKGVIEAGERSASKTAKESEKIARNAERRAQRGMRGVNKTGAQITHDVVTGGQALPSSTNLGKGLEGNTLKQTPVPGLEEKVEEQVKISSLSAQLIDYVAQYRRLPTRAKDSYTGDYIEDAEGELRADIDKYILKHPNSELEEMLLSYGAICGDEELETRISEFVKRKPYSKVHEKLLIKDFKRALRDMRRSLKDREVGYPGIVDGYYTDAELLAKSKDFLAHKKSEKLENLRKEYLVVSAKVEMLNDEIQILEGINSVMNAVRSVEGDISVDETINAILHESPGRAQRIKNIIDANPNSELKKYEKQVEAFLNK